MAYSGCVSMISKTTSEISRSANIKTILSFSVERLIALKDTTSLSLKLKTKVHLLFHYHNVTKGANTKTRCTITAAVESLLSMNPSIRSMEEYNNLKKGMRILK